MSTSSASAASSSAPVSATSSKVVRPDFPLAGHMSLEPRLKGKVCLVSGASRGFGQAIAIRFVEEGGRVALLSRGKCDETLRLISSIKGIDAAAVPSLAAWIPCDIETEADCNAAIAATIAKFGDEINGTRVDYSFFFGMVGSWMGFVIFLSSTASVVEMSDVLQVW